MLNSLANMLLNLRNQTLSKVFVLLFCLILLIKHYFLVWNFTLNVPIYDDIEAFCVYLSLVNGQDFKGFLKTTFLPSGDHLILSGHLISFIYFKIFKIFNIKDLILFLNLTYPLILILFYKIYLKLNLNIFGFIIIPILLFSLHSTFYAAFWLITTFQFPLITLLVLVSLYLVYSEKYFYLSILAAFIITFSHSNGFLIWFSGAIMLFALQRYKHLKIWMILSLAFVFIWLKIHTSIPQSSISEIDIVHVKNILLGIFCFLGSFFDPYFNESFTLNERGFLPVLFGILYFAILISLFVYEYFLKVKFNSNWKLRVLFFSVSFFYFGTAILIGIFRCSQNPFQFLSISPHYRSVSPILIILFYCYLLSLNYRTQIISGVFAVIILITVWINFFSAMNNLNNFTNQIYSNTINQMKNHEGITGSTKKRTGQVTRATLEKCRKQNIYNLTESEKSIEKLSFSNSGIPFGVSYSVFKDSSNLYVMFQSLSVKSKLWNSNRLFLVIRNHKNLKQIVFPIRHKVVRSLNPKHIVRPELLSANIDLNLVSNGKYSVQIVDNKNDEFTYYSCEDLEVTNSKF